MSPVASALKGAIHVYRYGISPLFPLACRFEPSCSAYALEAVRRHGALRGSGLTLRRLLKCHPWGGCGYDPVPGATDDSRLRVGAGGTPVDTIRPCGSWIAPPNARSTPNEEA